MLWFIKSVRSNRPFFVQLFSALSNRAQFNLLDHFLSSLPKAAFSDVVEPLLPLLPLAESQVFRLSTGRIVNTSYVKELNIYFTSQLRVFHVKTGAFLTWTSTTFAIFIALLIIILSFQHLS